MRKYDVFIASLLGGAWQHRDWVLTMFTRVIKPPVTEDYPWRIIKRDDNFYTLMPLASGGFVEELIEDVIINAPIVGVKEPVTLLPNSLPGIDRAYETNYGSIYANYIAVLYPFRGLVPYIETSFDPSDIEKKIIPLLTTTPGFENPPDDPTTVPVPVPLTERDPSRIYIDEYINWGTIINSTGALCQIAVSTATPKTIMPPPGLVEFRNKLLAPFRGKDLTAADVAYISEELIKFDKAWLADDPEALGFYITDKSFRIIRMKMYLMQGMETAFNENGGFKLIETSLHEGIKIQDLPTQINSGRTSSYSRGAMTALGGALVKFFYRVLQNTVIADEDCMDTQGLEIYTGNHTELLVGFYVIEGGKSKLIENEAAAQPYLFKRVRIRSPHRCKTGAPNFCKVCMGVVNAANPTSPAALGGEVGSADMNTFMKAMHGNAIKAVEIDLDEALL